MEDERITGLFFERDEDALNESRIKYGAYCRKIAYNILESSEDAEEILSDTLFKAWNAIPPARPDRLGAYLGRIARNLALNRWESRRARCKGWDETARITDELEVCLPSSVTVESESDERTLRSLINSFLETLPKETRIVFVRRYWYMQQVKEISRACGITESKTKMLLLRTRNSLKDFLDREDFKV